MVKLIRLRDSLNLVSWRVVSQPQSRGGLGLGNIINRNKALLGKWLWRFPLEVNSLWYSVIKSKYGLHKNGWDVADVARGSSRYPWVFISKGKTDFYPILS